MKKSRTGLKASLLALSCSLALSLSACGGGGSAGGGTAELAESGRGAELRMQFTGPPVSLDPALAGTGGSTAFVSLAYDPLIFMDSKGGFVPALATSWRYADDTNTTFELTIREGVKFADGEALTPEAVKASMEYFLKNAGPKALKVGPIASIEAAKNTVTVKYSSPFPEAESTFTQEWMFGNIISPAGLANPKSLLVETQGTGQYQLSGGETVADSKYVYDRNENYWLPEAQQFEQVSISVIGDPNAVISAVTTGQVDYASGSASTLDAAKAANLEVGTTPFFNWSLYLADKKGTLNPALADARVRKAIGLAINREAIANAVGSEVSEANGQIMNKGARGYVEGLGFGYDPEEAKRLLAAAGYPNGFPLTILTQNTIDNQTIRSQAIADNLKQIGINVHLEVITTGIANFTTEALSKKYEAVIFPLTGTSTGAAHKDMLQSGSRNPFGIVEPEIDALYKKSLLAGSADERTRIYEEMSREYYKQAYVIPVFTAKNLKYVGPTLTNVNSSALNPTDVPTGPGAEYSWQPKK
ncbi:ABC transporter substrate-binding protein [Arthrobacter sp. W4I7]|uniref:ABC transporter substrate-binding protein n=1 Tax=Arthrobacter sp. W4I7 TaxID=3042296 RepID=UPI002787AC99|nr:ABC transporter substrate-binding protein [Arthrobacter sp. W4I7]MDQ0693084.1 peptide/nickel transport system substrate-binding protein [Arthrobacter sp. W4I7]